MYMEGRFDPDSEEPPHHLNPDQLNIGPYLKCERVHGELDFDHLTIHDFKKFQIELEDINKKRSIQEKLVEFMVSRMFSKDCIYSLVEFLFRDMLEDYLLLIKDDGQDDSDDEDNKKKEFVVSSSFKKKRNRYVKK